MSQRLYYLFTVLLACVVLSLVVGMCFQMDDDVLFIWPCFSYLHMFFSSCHALNSLCHCSMKCNVNKRKCQYQYKTYSQVRSFLFPYPQFILMPNCSSLSRWKFLSLLISHLESVDQYYSSCQCCHISWMTDKSGDK